jgi:hypothetical protein
VLEQGGEIKIFTAYGEQETQIEESPIFMQEGLSK